MSLSDAGLVPFTDRWLQDLLWSHMKPEEHLQSRQYSKLDMMKWMEQGAQQGSMFFWGSKQAGMIFRCFKPNEYVVEPHIVGSPRYLRSLMPLGLDYIFKETPILRANVYTHLPSIRAIYLKLGFTEHGRIPASFYVPDQGLLDYWCLGYTQEDHHRKQSVV